MWLVLQKEKLLYYLYAFTLWNQTHKKPQDFMLIIQVWDWVFFQKIMLLELGSDNIWHIFGATSQKGCKGRNKRVPI